MDIENLLRPHWTILLLLLLVNSRDYRKATQAIFAKFVGTVAHGPRKNAVDFGGNPDHVRLGRVRAGLWLRLAGGRTIFRDIAGFLAGAESYRATRSMFV